MKLKDVFAVLKPDLSIEPVPVTPTIYADLDARFDSFKSHVLVSIYEFDADWGVWERHPAGDEMVMLLSGSVTLVLRTPSGEQATELTEPDSYVIIPRNTWHTARTSCRVRMLFVTPGEGTENREHP